MREGTANFQNGDLHNMARYPVADAIRIIGYFSNVKGCVERVVRLIPLDENDGKVISMREYAEAVEKAFKRVSELKL